MLPPGSGPETVDVDLNRVAVPLSWSELFGRDAPVELEIGSGKGRFLLDLAALRPATSFLAVERAGKYHRLVCERVAKRGLGKGALLIAGDKLVILGQKGDLVIAEATPSEFKGLSRTSVVPGGVCWTTPVVLDGLIYCRNSLGDLVCRDHRAE